MPRDKTIDKKPFINLPNDLLTIPQIRAIMGYKDIRLKEIASEVDIPIAHFWRCLQREKYKDQLRWVSDYMRNKFLEN